MSKHEGEPTSEVSEIEQATSEIIAELQASNIPDLRIVIERLISDAVQMLKDRRLIRDNALPPEERLTWEDVHRGDHDQYRDLAARILSDDAQDQN